MAGTSPAMTTSKASQKHQRSDALRRQRGLGLFSDRLERRRLVDGEIRQLRGTRVLFKTDGDNIKKYFLPNA